MPAPYKRNILRIGPPPAGSSKTAITEAMVEAVRRRVDAVGITLVLPA
jgi:hypothetical protein